MKICLRRKPGNMPQGSGRPAAAKYGKQQKDIRELPAALPSLKERKCWEVAHQEPESADEEGSDEDDDDASIGPFSG